MKLWANYTSFLLWFNDNLFFVFSIFNIFINACISGVFPLSNVFTKIFTFTFLFFGGGVILFVSSPTSFSLLNSSIFVSASDVSKGPEQTALIPPFASTKTGFTMMNHSGSSFQANPWPFFFESKTCLHFCFMLLYFVLNRLWSISNGTRSPLFLWNAAFRDRKGSAFMASLFQQRLHRKLILLRISLTLFVLTSTWSRLLGPTEFHKRDWFRLLPSFLKMFSSALTFFK